MNAKLFSAALLVALLTASAAACARPSLPPVERLVPGDHAPLALVADGVCRFAIVGRFKAEYAYRGPEGAGLMRFGRDSVNRAAKALKTYFRETVGAEPPQLEEDDPKVADYPFVIALGPTRYARALGLTGADLPHEGFEVRTFAGGVAIVGMDGFARPGCYDVFCWRSPRLNCNGTEHGARDFAERYLGVRTYSTKDDGLWTVRPKIRDLTVDPVAYRDRPRFRLRGNRAFNWRLGESTDIFCTEAPNPFVFAKAHKDSLDELFYTDADGVLQQSFTVYGQNYFDVTGTKLADRLVADWKAFYDNNGTNSYWGSCWTPTSRCLFFGQVDAYRILDNERARRYIDPADPKNMSDVYAAFHTYLANEVAKAFPGKRLVVMAYLNFLKPPKMFDRLPDNVEVMVCNGSPLFHGCAAYRRFFDENLARWTAMTKYKPALYVYDAGFANDAVIVQTLRGYYEGAFLRDVMPRIDNEFIFPCYAPKSIDYNWSYYPACLALWNPDTDVEAVLEEYYRLMFGPKAGPKLLDFYHRLADRWSNHYLPSVTKGVDGSIPGPDYKYLYTETFPGHVVRGLEALLDEAEAMLPAGSKERRRFDLYAKPYRRVFPDIVAYQNIRIPEIGIARRNGAIELDGVPDEPAWTASVLPPFQRAFAGGPVRSPTPRAHVLWDEKGVYLGVRSPGPVKIDKDLWKGDSVEFIFTPAGSSPHLYQFVCAANGAFMDIYRQWNPPRPIDVNWVAEGARYVSKGTPDGWTCELFVPWSALRDKPPKAGDRWKMNLVSSRALPVWEDQSVSPTLQNNRRVDMFGGMVFK